VRMLRVSVLMCTPRSVVACGLDGCSGELFERRLTPDRRDIVSWIRSLPGPVAVTYEAGPPSYRNRTPPGEHLHMPIRQLFRPRPRLQGLLVRSERSSSSSPFHPVGK